MCGIVGAWGPMENRQDVIAASRKVMRHRGPDSDGYWEDPEAGIGLAHVRLAIVDLSEAGHQPMLSACGRYVLVLNGEIYNHLDLRELLQVQGRSPDWRGHSDTETLLAVISAWGLETALESLVGMFAFALWDREKGQLSLARDRMGEKPLYWGHAGATIAFASELKALRDMPGFDATLDRDALALMMRHNYIPAPFSIYTGVRKLMPGHFVTITADHLRQKALPPGVAYWSAWQTAHKNFEQPLSFSRDDDAIDALEQVLTTAVRAQMMADVPLGAFLSGGVDSSLIVALMQNLSASPVNTFAIGFEESAWNEAHYAAEVAAHLGTRHTELYVTEADALAVVPRLPDIYDEPFADSSQIPTVLLMQMAAGHVTVALSGDGGDELFGGYSRYQRALQWWEKRCRLPGIMRKPVGSLAQVMGALLPRAIAGQAEKFNRLMQASGSGPFYRQFVSYWDDPAVLVYGAKLPETVFDQPCALPMAEHMMLLDTLTYLPDDILVKVDRAAMAASLETRIPLLDHRVYAFARRLAPQYKIRDGQGKWLMRQLLYRHVPEALIDRPKKGFGVPLGQWLRGPLNDWANGLLDSAHVARHGVFDARQVQAKWQAHCAGQHDFSAHLWGVLMTQAWLDSRATGGYPA